MVSLPLANEPTLKVSPEVCFGQIVERRIQIGHFILLPQSQRIEIRMLVTTEAVCVNELQDFYLLHIGVRVGDR